MQYDAIVCCIKTINRAHRLTRRVSAVHTGNRYGFLPRLTITQCYYTPAINTPRHFILVLACSDTTVTFDAALCITKEFHSSHAGLLAIKPLLFCTKSICSLASELRSRSRRSSWCYLIHHVHRVLHLLDTYPASPYLGSDHQSGMA